MKNGFVTGVKAGRGSDRLLIFCYFIAGAAGLYFCPIPLPDFPEPRVFLCGLLIGIMLLSTSFFGGFAFPLIAGTLGAFAERMTLESCFAEPKPVFPSLRAALCGMILLPVFFFALQFGLGLSAGIQASLRGGSPSVRLDYRKSWGALAVVSLLGFAAIFYFF